MTQQPAVAPSQDLSRYFVILRQRWLVVLVAVGISLLAAVAYLQVKPTQATANASVQINVVTDQAFNNQRALSALVDAQTEQQLARSSVVLSAASDDLGGSVSVSRLRRNLAISVLPASTVVRVSYTADTARQAVAGADAIATAYIDFRQTQAEAKLNAILDKLNQRRASLRSRLVDANAKVATAPAGSGRAVQAASEAQLVNLELTTLLTRINDLGGVDTSGGLLITSAKETSVTVTPSKSSVLVTAAAVGLLVGLVLAFVVSALDRRVTERAGVPSAGGGVVLSQLRGRRGSVPPEPQDLDDMRALRERLLATLPADPVLAVEDLTTQKRPSDVAVNLAWAFAESGRQVHLVLPGYDDAFLSYVADQLDLDHGQQGERSTLHQSQSQPRLHVSVIPSRLGDDPSNGVLDAMVAPTPGRVVIIALPSGATRALRLAAARLGHSTILVVTVKGTRRAEIANVASELRAVNAEVYGTVLVSRKRRTGQPGEDGRRGSGRGQTGRSNRSGGDPSSGVDTPGDALSRSSR